MIKRFVFPVILCSFFFSSCYLKAYRSAMYQNGIVQGKYDSARAEINKRDIDIHNKEIEIQDKQVAINKLEAKNDSLGKAYESLGNRAMDFRRKYVHFPTGAKFSSVPAIRAAKRYQAVEPAIKLTNVLYNPVTLSIWGNDIHGDCVTAEVAFAKATNVPESFMPDNTAIAWASQNGVLEGAIVNDVLAKMTDVGFRLNGMTFNDGSYSYVDFTNPSVLQNAIAAGPVKLGLTSTQLDGAWNPFFRGWFALNFAPEQVTATNQHCASLCGYGTFAWLAQQFNVLLPNGVNPSEIGYALFTCGSIGLIDLRSIQAITHEGWIRNPTNVTNNSVSSYILKAMGGEDAKNIYLSHAFNGTDLRATYPGGFGEMWICHDIGGGKIKLQARGAEAGNNYLSHANGNISLHNTYDGGSGEEWIVHNLPNGQFALEAGGGEQGQFLSHAFGNLNLRRSNQGGEAWLNVGQQ